MGRQEELGRFIQVIAGYTMMSDDELGLDTIRKQDVDSCFITLEQDGAEKPMELRMEPYPHPPMRNCLSRVENLGCLGT
jgi:hypothetical protein